MLWRLDKQHPSAETYGPPSISLSTPIFLSGHSEECFHSQAVREAESQGSVIPAETSGSRGSTSALALSLLGLSHNQSIFH